MRIIRLVESKSVDEFAQMLHGALRSGDHQKLDAIYVSRPVGEGLAIAIRDRLARASS